LARNLHSSAAGNQHALDALEDAMAERSERDVLHHLIDLCRDGERGFRSAADHVSDPTLKSLFMDLATQRKRFAEELLPHLQRLGAPPDADGTSAGRLHRQWMVLKGLVPGRHDHHIVVEAERGEHVVLDAYEEALNGMLPPTVTDIIESQREAIVKANDRIRSVDMGYSVAN
jgi:uncharacterized protein (TIGR02284 family)